MRLEVTHLEVLRAIERAGSLSRAAQALDTDQPHVSRTLRRIEAHLGFPVFDRGPHGASPTAAGRDVLDRAARALDAIGRLQRPESPAERSTLRVLCHQFPGGEVARRLRAESPDLDFTMSTSAPEAAYRELAGGTADVLVAGRAPHVTWQRPAQVTEVEALTTSTVVFLPAGHRLAGSAEVDLRDLAEENWIVDATPQAERSLVEECRLLGGFRPRIRYRADSFDASFSLLKRGLGVRHGPPHPVRDVFVARPYRGAGVTTVVVAAADTDVAGRLAGSVVAAARAAAADGLTRVVRA